MQSNEIGTSVGNEISRKLDTIFVTYFRVIYFFNFPCEAVIVSKAGTVGSIAVMVCLVFFSVSPFPSLSPPLLSLSVLVPKHKQGRGI